MYIRTIDRRFTQMIAYFLVMNSKRFILLNGRCGGIQGNEEFIETN